MYRLMKIADWLNCCKIANTYVAVLIMIHFLISIFYYYLAPIAQHFNYILLNICVALLLQRSNLYKFRIEHSTPQFYLIQLMDHIFFFSHLSIFIKWILHLLLPNTSTMQSHFFICLSIFYPHSAYLKDSSSISVDFYINIEKT